MSLDVRMLSKTTILESSLPNIPFQPTKHVWLNQI